MVTEQRAHERAKRIRKEKLEYEMEKINQMEAGQGNTSIKIVLDEMAFAGDGQVKPEGNAGLVGVKE